MDFGLVVVTSNLVIFLAERWQEKEKLRSLKNNRTFWIFSLLAAAVLAIITSNTDLAPKLDIMAEYLSKQIPIVSYVNFYKAIDYRSLMQLVILPGITCVFLAYLVRCLLLKSVNNNHLYLFLLSIYLSSCTLMMSTRSLHRHSLIEGLFNNYLYLITGLVALLIIWLRCRLNAKFLAPVIALYIALTNIAIPKTENMLIAALEHHQTRWEFPSVDFTHKIHTKPEQQRLDNQVTKYDDFVQFMNLNLNPEQTFYDFSNAPLLYALSDVQAPNYILETVYQSTNKLQLHTIKELEQLRQAGRLPYVLFRQNTKMDHLDGIDNALRSFSIAEYIYKHFAPCARINNIDIWSLVGDQQACYDRVEKFSQYKEGIDLERLTNNYLKQLIDFRHIPAIWALGGTTDTTESTQINVSQENITSTEYRIYNDSGINCPTLPCFLNLQVSSEIEQNIQLTFEDKTHLTFTLRPGVHHYRIRISILWALYKSPLISEMIISGEQSFKILSATSSKSS